ncbi:MAG: CoA pyrophosphatase, partial [Oscillospiraceae bacterium]|nr:CoA pyrophosphatase [Oscillospiraceae bacterium]
MDLTELKTRLGGHEAELIRPPRTLLAAVLVPLLERDGALHVLFEQRDAHIMQGGEICFPGGHVEPG